MLGIEWTRRRGILTGTFALVFVVLAAIVGAVYCDVLTLDQGGLLMSGTLTLATAGYVLLTFDMARTMREQMQIQERRNRLEKQPSVKNALETSLIPLHNDVMNVKGGLSGTGGVAIDDDEYYQSFPYVPTEYEDPMTVPRLQNTQIAISPGDAHEFYDTYRQYREVYGTAVHELEMLILQKFSDPPTDSDMLREYAMIGLQLNTDQIRGDRARWERIRREVLPLRKEIPELIRELNQLRGEIRGKGGELARNLSDAWVEAVNTYEIDPETLNPDSIKTEWPNDETGESGVYIGELPRRPEFADIVVEEDEDCEGSGEERDEE